MRVEAERAGAAEVAYLSDSNWGRSRLSSASKSNEALVPASARDEVDELTEPVAPALVPFPLEALVERNILRDDLLDDLRPVTGDEERGVCIVCCDPLEPSPPPPVGVRSLCRTLPNRFEDFALEFGVEGPSSY